MAIIKIHRTVLAVFHVKFISKKKYAILTMFFTSNNFLQHFPDNETKLFIDDIE